MKQNNKFYRNIMAIILSLIMLFSNITNTLAYEWDLQIPSIDGGNDIIINGNDDLIIDDTVIIDTSPNTNNNISNPNNQNGNVEIETTNPNINIENNQNKVNYDTTPLSGDFDKNNGLTVTVPIIPSVPPITAKNGEQQLTLTGSDKGADATVTFKGDEKGATTHAIIDYITRENNDPNAVGYCISPFYAGAKENGTTVVKVDNNLTENDKLLLGIAVAGHPHNKFNVAGFNELNDEDQYYATLIAMEHFIFQKKGEYKNKKGVEFKGDHWNSTRWFPTKSNDANAQKIINVAKGIYEKGMSNPYDPEKGIATINFKDNTDNQGTLNPNDGNYKITITLTSDINYSHAVLQF